MPDISIQFFATPDEIYQFVQEVIENYSVFVVAMRYQPFEARKVDIGELGRYLSPSSDFCRWAFLTENPILPVKHELDFGDQNPDHLRLEVGEFDGASLKESWLSCRTGNKAAFAVWKKIAKRLKEMTFAGITATHQRTGASAEYKSQRYSIGAKQMEDRGIVMLGPVGSRGPTVKLGLHLSQPQE
jgi:hypothetical protein